MKARCDLLTRKEAQNVALREYLKIKNMIYQEVARDIALQLLGVCLVELATDFNFGKKRLNQFIAGVDGLFAVDKIMGKDVKILDFTKTVFKKYSIDMSLNGSHILKGCDYIGKKG